MSLHSHAQSSRQRGTAQGEGSGPLPRLRLPTGLSAAHTRARDGAGPPRVQARQEGGSGGEAQALPERGLRKSCPAQAPQHAVALLLGLLRPPHPPPLASRSLQSHESCH